jgi:WD40 repeat protein
VVKVLKADGSLAQELTGSGTLQSVSWSADGKLVAIGSETGAVTVWDVKTKKSKKTENACKDRAKVETLSWNPKDQPLLAIGCGGQSGAYVYRWMAESGDLVKDRDWRVDEAGSKPEANIRPHASWSPDGRVLALARDGDVQLWTHGSLNSIGVGDLGPVVWSPHGRILAAASGSSIKLFQPDGRPLMDLKGHTQRINSLTWNSNTDSDRLVSASEDGTIKLWNIKEDEITDAPLKYYKNRSCEWLSDYLDLRNSLILSQDKDVQSFCADVNKAGPTR